VANDKDKLYYGDNLEVLQRYVKDKSVDLVYLDPPFNSRQDYNVLFAEKDGSQSSSQIHAFEDTWEWNNRTPEAFTQEIEKMGSIRLKIEDQVTVAEILDQHTVISQNTGKELFQLEVKFKVHENHRNLYTAALGKGTATLLSPEGDSTKDITVGVYEKQHSYTVGQSIQLCTWLLSEREELKLESLQIGDMTLTPYKYEDHFDLNALICTTCMIVDATTYENLRNLPAYFPVIRKGISDEPRSMRLGLVLWSSDDEETFKVKATLVEESYDKNGRALNLLEPMFTNVMQQLAVTSARFTQLLNVLEAKGILTEEEKNGVFEVPESELRHREDLFYRLRDLDKWVELDN
jgi:hypothetical protein